MKRQKDFLKGQLVKVPLLLTADPADRRGETAVITSADPNEDRINVRFEDGTVAAYAFNALETLLPPKVILQKLHESRNDISRYDYETILNVVRLAKKGSQKKALELAWQASPGQDICITDTDSFYQLKQKLSKGKWARKFRKRR